MLHRLKKYPALRVGRAHARSSPHAKIDTNRRPLHPHVGGCKPSPMPRPRSGDRDLQRVTIDVTGDHFAPLHAYAASQGLTATQAARELLLAALRDFPTDGAYVAAALKAYADARRTAFATLSAVLRGVWAQLDAEVRENSSDHSGLSVAYSAETVESDDSASR